MKRFLLGMIGLAIFTACDSKKEEGSSEGVTMEDVVTQDQENKNDPQEPASTNPKLDSLNLLLINDYNNVDALVARTKEYIKMKNLQYALADAKAAHDLDSTNPAVLLNWGEVNYFFNKTRISRDSWVECARIDKQNVDCRLKLAELYHIVEEYEKSLKMAREVTQIENDNATAYLILGLDYRDGINDTATALQYIQKAIDLQENYFEAIEHAALLYTHMANPGFEENQRRLAEGYYARMIELEPTNYWVYYNQGIYYYNLEEWNKCLESLTKASQLKSNDPEVYLTMGMVHLKISAYPEARDLFTKAIEYSPSQANYRAHYSRGYAYERLGDITNAQKDYMQARTYNPVYEPA